MKLIEIFILVFVSYKVTNLSSVLACPKSESFELIYPKK